MLILPNVAERYTSMQALAYHGPGKCALEDKPEPALRVATDANFKVGDHVLNSCIPNSFVSLAPRSPPALVCKTLRQGDFDEQGSRTVD